MLKYTLFILSLLSASKAWSQDFPQQKADAKIDHVTVFLNGAQVIRTAKMSLPNGKSEVLLRGLTPNFDAQSVTVKGDGDFTILSVKPQMNFLEELKRKDTILNLEANRDKLLDLILQDSSEILILKNEEEILMKNRVQVIGLQDNTNKSEELTNLLDIQRKRLKDIYEKKFALQKNGDKTRRELYKIAAQLNELNAKKTTTTAEVLVTIFVKDPSVQNAQLTLEYIVPNTNWYPTYDIRVKDVTTAMQAQMKAKVRQNSGEDWREVKLTLSTGEPKRTGVKPELGTWILGEYGKSYFIGQQTNEVEDFTKLRLANQSNKIRGRISEGEEVLVGAAVVIQGTTRGTVTDLDGNFELTIMPTDRNLTISYVGYETQTMPITASNSFIDIKLKENVATLQEVVVTGYASSENEAYAPRRGVKNYGETKRKSASGAAHTITDKAFKTEKLQVKENEQATTIAFDIDLPYTIPTNGKEYQVDIKEVNLPATYQYSVAPKLDNDAFLTAYLTDWEQYNLVEGEANLYFEGTYLGKTLLKTNSTEDTLKISLGRDKNVVVTRVKLKEFSKNKTFSSKKIDSRAFEISIKNKKSIPLSITIEDQVPTSSDKQIDIDYEAVGATIDKLKGRLTWKLDLKPLEDRKLKFSYSVKHPVDWQMWLE